MGGYDGLVSGHPELPDRATAAIYLPFLLEMLNYSGRDLALPAIVPPAGHFCRDGCCDEVHRNREVVRFWRGSCCGGGIACLDRRGWECVATDPAVERLSVLSVRRFNVTKGYGFITPDQGARGRRWGSVRGKDAHVDGQ